MTRISLFLLLFLSIPAYAIEKLPDPLTFEHVLSLGDNNYPAISRAEIRLSQSEKQTALSKTTLGLDIRAQARVRWVDPPGAISKNGREDHRANLFLLKPIYDFGRTGNAESASKANEVVSKLQLRKTRQQHRINIMRAYFNVVLADLNFNFDNEAMAIAFINFDRKQDRQSVGQASDIDVMEAESSYLQVRRTRYESETRQRSSRAELSILLNRPNDLPSKVLMPKLNYHKRAIPELEELYAQALEKNLDLQILREQINSLRFELQSIQADRKPVLSIEAEAGIYEREIGSNDRWRAGLLLDIPLYQAGKISKLSALKRLEIQKLESLLYEKELQVKQQILDHWLALDYLLAEKQSTDKTYEYRELYLDRARADYELEFKSDLGDAMVKLTEASLNSAQTSFELTIHWEELALLTQTPIEESKQ